jgi:hypothetical protein
VAACASGTSLAQPDIHNGVRIAMTGVLRSAFLGRRGDEGLALFAAIVPPCGGGSQESGVWGLSSRKEGICSGERGPEGISGKFRAVCRQTFPYHQMCYFWVAGNTSGTPSSAEYQ